jgi:hypothetical protein
MDYKNLKIENISFKQTGEEDYEFTFEINGFPYVMAVYKEENEYEPSFVIHGTEDKICPVCNGTPEDMEYDCWELYDDNEALFNYLKDHSDVRLKFLFKQD